MNVRFYHARIATMIEPIEIFWGQVWVCDSRILYVGEGKPDDEAYQKLLLRDITWDREIDCEGNLLMPGFKNAHTHSAMVLFRSMADDKPLQSWLEECIFPIENRLTTEDIYELTEMSVLEYLSGGITGVFDMYLMPEPVTKAFEEMGMRNVQVSGINNFTYGPDALEKYYQTINGNYELSSFVMGAHAEYTCSEELLNKVAGLVHKYKSPFFAHICETQLEVIECKERYGKTPVQLFDSMGMFDYGGGGYHCLYFEEDDYRIFKEKNLYVVTNPASNLKLASGIAPISRFLKEKIPVAIGTDGAGSNNCLDMFREMFLVTGLAKYADRDATSVDALEVLKMATVNGAHAMGLWDSDVLASGKLADLIMIDLKQPNMQPLNNILKNVVYSGSKQNVKLTMIHGKILYEDGRYYTKESPECLYEKVNKIAEKMKRR